MCIVFLFHCCCRAEQYEDLLERKASGVDLSTVSGVSPLSPSPFAAVAAAAVGGLLLLFVVP